MTPGQTAALRILSWWTLVRELPRGELLCEGAEGRQWVLERGGLLRPWRAER